MKIRVNVHNTYKTMIEKSPIKNVPIDNIVNITLRHNLLYTHSAYKAENRLETVLKSKKSFSNFQDVKPGFENGEENNTRIYNII